MNPTGISKYCFTAILAAVVCGVSAVGAWAHEPIRFPDRAGASGVHTLENFSAEPDSRGEVAALDLAPPAYRRGVCLWAHGWPVVSQSPRILKFTPDATATINEGGQAMLLELESGEWLAVLPLPGEQVLSWFRGTPSGVKVVVGHFGTAKVEGAVPTVAYGRGGDPYEALRLAWTAAAADPQVGRGVKLRETKTYPEIFKYLGWCSWEQYRFNITEELMISAIRNIEASGLPIRYTLLDDGHFDRQSLRPHPVKFPHGYDAMLALRKPDKIRWMGVWWAIFGDTHGVDAPGALDPSLSKYMWTSHSNELLPLPGDVAASRAFFNDLLVEKSRGFDFFKIDFQERPFLHYAGLQKLKTGLLQHGVRPPDNSHACANPYQAQTVLMQVVQELVAEKFQGMMNCTAIASWSLFFTGTSATTRCSGDYKVGNLAKAKAHLHESYRLMPWIGDIVWGDHDMFHSNDPFAGRMMAASKALSGGPIYVSDDPLHFDASAIRPLCYEDGLLLRPLAPAAPVVDDLFVQQEDPVLYRVSAPLANDCAAFAVYNFQGEPKGAGPALATTLTPAHYANATAMMRPYPGKRDIPAEGLLCYDVYGTTAVRMGDGVKVEITGFGDKVYQVSPIRDGWAVVGRSDKYLPAAGVEVVSSGKDSLKLRLREAGPITLWLAEGAPRAEGVRFVDQGGGLFTADLPVGGATRELAVTRIQK